MRKIIVQPHEKIITYDTANSKTGWLLPVFNVHDGVIAPEQHPQQVYLTVLQPGTTKGPHLHMRRWGLLTCIRGDVRIIIRDEEGSYRAYFSGESYMFTSVQVPSGCAAAIYNLGTGEAYVLNMPSPAWSKDDPDEHPVGKW